MEHREAELSVEREELLRHRLEKETLAYCQEKFAGEVSLLLVRRTRAVVALKSIRVQYHLQEKEPGTCELYAHAISSESTLKTRNPDLWSLGLHIAAEAMLALRNGHKEYVRVKRRTKQHNTQADAP